jgi:hypothetical protein
MGGVPAETETPTDALSGVNSKLPSAELSSTKLPSAELPSADTNPERPSSELPLPEIPLSEVPSEIPSEVYGEMPSVYLPTPPGPLTPPAAAAALANVRHCVVALTEHWADTAELIVNHWFPWIDFQDYTILRTEVLMGHEKELASFVRPEVREYILEQNRCDTALYATMKILHDKQLEVVKAVAYSDNQ